MISREIPLTATDRITEDITIYTFPESTSRLTRFSTEDHLKWNRFEVCFSRAMVREAEHPSATHA